MCKSFFENYGMCTAEYTEQNYELSFIEYNLSSELLLKDASLKELFFFISIIICIVIIFFNILTKFCCKDTKKDKLIKKLCKLNQELRKKNNRLNEKLRKFEFKIEELQNDIEITNNEVKEKYEEIKQFEILQEYSDVIDFIKYAIEKYLKHSNKNINLILYTSVDDKGNKYIHKIDFGYLSTQIQNWLQNKTFIGNIKYRSQFYKELEYQVEYQKNIHFLGGYIYKLQEKFLLYDDIVICLAKYKDHKIVHKGDKIIYEM